MSNESYYFKIITQEDFSFLKDMLYLAIYVSDDRPVDKEIIYDPNVYKYIDKWDEAKDLGYILIDKDSQHKMGAVWIRGFAENNPGYGYIDESIPELSIAIYPEYRSQGFGTLLIQHLIKTLPQRINALSLSVDVRNPAMRLYERLGFKTHSLHDCSVIMKYECQNIRR